MGWVNDLHGQTIGLDTAPLIYFIERHSDYIQTLRPFFVSLSEGKLRVVTSTVTLLEVLVQPLRRGDEALAHRYNDILLSSSNISTLPLTHAHARLAAELRARFNLKTADSIQLAVAIDERATVLLTNDRRIPDNCGITVLRLADLIAK
jgi:predicted nucleic acid-binding protein